MNASVVSLMLIVFGGALMVLVITIVANRLREPSPLVRRRDDGRNGYAHSGYDSSASGSSRGDGGSSSGGDYSDAGGGGDSGAGDGGGGSAGH